MSVLLRHVRTVDTAFTETTRTAADADQDSLEPTAKSVSPALLK